MPEPERGVAYTFRLGLVAPLTGAFLVNPPLAAGDFQLSQDGAALTGLTNAPVVLPPGSALVQISLTAAEMTAGEVVLLGHDPDGQWQDIMVLIQPTETLGSDHRVLLSVDTQPTLPANVVALAGNGSSPPVLDRSARSMGRGVVGSGASTTSIPTSSLVPGAAIANQFGGRVLVFEEDTLTPALRSQSGEITASASDGTLTVSPLTTAPEAGDKFLII